MTAPNERNEGKDRAMFVGGGEGTQPGDLEYGDAFAAYQKIEGLFDLLRQPATVVDAHGNDALAGGNRLGEFAILRPLACGGMGQVYLARQESLGRLVALKVCKPEIARDPRMKSRFITEALSLAQLTHPNVVPVLSTGEDQGYLYLAMEYIAGPTLAQLLQAIQIAQPDSLASNVVAQVLATSERAEQSQSWGKRHAILDRAYQTWAIQTLQQVAQGLAAAHAAGILHRDIKPANIVFAANGVPKIVDFGLARTARAPSTTVMGEFYGTPAYTSPEQARGDVEAVSPASDVFSFGVTLFECLSLDLPFPGRTSADVLSSVLNSDAPLLRRVEKRIPSELEAITDKCLRKNPAARYSSAQALADDLRNYLELRPVTAKPTSRIGRVGRMIRRRPWVAAFLLTLLFAGVLGAFVAKNAWAAHKTEKIKTFNKRVDEGDIALFRCLTGQRPTWLPTVIDLYRKQGIDAYSAALDLQPNAVWPLVQRARLYASKQETLDLALADLEKAQEREPEFGSIRKFRGYVLDELGRNDEGLTASEQAKARYPTAAEDLYWLGVIAYSKEQDFFASYTYFSQALLIAPNDYWTRLERAYFGRIASEGDDTARRVIPELEIAKTIRPELPFASELLAKFYSTDPVDALGASRQKKELAEQIEWFGLDLLRAHDMSELLQKEQKYDDAEAILHKVLDQDTGGRTAEQIGNLEYRRGNFEAARDWYRRAISEGANYPVIHLHLANTFTAMKDMKGAERAYLDGIAEYPQEAFLYWSLGSWYEARGRFVDAEKIYRTGCELPSDVEGSPRSSAQLGDLAMCFQDLSSLLMRLGRQPENTQVLQQGLDRLEKALHSASVAEPRASIAHHVATLKNLLGQAYIFAGKRDDALSLINSEMKKRPITLEHGQMLAELCGLLGMPQAALDVARLSEFAICQQQSPSNNVLARQTARIFVDGQLRQMGLSKELLDRIETRRTLGETLSPIDFRDLGKSYQGAEALAVLHEGVTKHPDSVGLQTDYMQQLANAGQKDEAWKAYEKVRDLYFALIERRDKPVLRMIGQPMESFYPSPAFDALPWYLYLLQEGKEDEFHRLDQRLREICPKTMTDPKDLRLPRASAEFVTGKYAAAIKSFEFCLQNKVGNEAFTSVALARSFRALGNRQDAIKWYRRAVQVSDADPGFVSELLSIIVEEEGVNGLLQELRGFDPWRKLDVRLNATLTAFSSWAALVSGDEKAAFENLVQAECNAVLASQQVAFAGDEGLVCVLIVQIVSEKLADSNRLARATEFLKRFPGERVRTMRELFSLPKRK